MALAIMVLIVVAFVFLLYLPKQEEYSASQEQNEKLTAKLREDQAIAADLPRFKAEYEKMNKQLEQALKELPNEKEIPTLLTTISSLAKESGLDVLRFKPGNEIPQGFYAQVPVDLKLVGSYHQVASFFYSVGDLPRIVNISNVKLGGPKASPGGILLSVDCLATTFRFLENPAGGDSAVQKKGKK
jgi:type IV pilus assembly protein PilO